MGYEAPVDVVDLTLERRFARLLTLGARAKTLCGERQAVLMLKHLTFGLLKAVNGAAELRRRAGCAKTLDELLDVFKEGAS